MTLTYSQWGPFKDFKPGHQNWSALGSHLLSDGGLSGRCDDAHFTDVERKLRELK